MIRDHDDNVKSHPQRLVLRSKRLSKIPTTSQPSHIQRPAKYKQWKEGGDLKLEKAVSEVLSNQLSIRKAAEQYGIPRSTLHDHVSGRVQPGASSGPKRYLSQTKEDELVSFVTKSSQVGYTRTRSDVSIH